MAKKLTSHEKEKGCWFTAVSHDEKCRDLLKLNCKEFPFWGWIDHVPDKSSEEEDSHFHTHIIIRSGGTRSIRQVASVLHIPVNYCQVVHQKRSLMRYFIHLDNPEKVQYHETDIHSNQISLFKEAWIDNADNDVRRLFSDLDDLYFARITIPQFIDRHYIEFQKMPFYQKIKIYEFLQKQFNALELPDVLAHDAPR